MVDQFYTASLSSVSFPLHATALTTNMSLLTTATFTSRCADDMHACVVLTM